MKWGVSRRKEASHFSIYQWKNTIGKYFFKTYIFYRVGIQTYFRSTIVERKEHLSGTIAPL